MDVLLLFKCFSMEFTINLSNSTIFFLSVKGLSTLSSLSRLKLLLQRSLPPISLPLKFVSSHFQLQLLTEFHWLPERRVGFEYLILNYFIKMAFRIRDKSLFWTKSGWKNNWEPKILNMPKAINPTTTQYVIMRGDYNSFLRSINSIMQSSRPIVTSLVPANSISTAIPLQNSSLFSNSEINSSYLFIVRLLLSSSRTEQ